MRIGVDIRILAKEKRTGIEDYTINLLSYLLARDKKIKYKLFYNSFKKSDLNYDFLKLPNISLKKMHLPNRILDLFFRFLKTPKIDRILKGIDIFLSPHFLLAPTSKKIKTVTIFYDLSFIRFPEFFSLPKLLWHRFIYPKQKAKKTNIIVAISQSTKKDLIDLYNIDKKRIKVIYPGIDKKFKPLDKNNFNFQEVKKKYNIPDNFVLYFGTIEPRKNILSIIRSFEKIKSNFIFNNNIKWRGFEGVVKKQKKDFDFSNLKLVIAGAKGWLYDKVFKTVDNSEFKKDIIFTDFIEERDKIYLYNLADLFIYPSFFEGFGLPPLEAMACGVPTIVSDKPSLSEVVGDGAVMVDPNDIDSIAFAVKEILSNRELADFLRHKGLKRVENFSWEKTADNFLDLFKKINSD